MMAARKKAIEYYTADAVRTTTRTTGQLDEVLYYLAYEYEQANDLDERAQGLLRAHPEAADSRSTSRTRTSRSASCSSTRRRAIRRKWDLAAQAYTRGHQVPAAGQQGLRLRLVQARLRLLEQGRASTRRSTRSRRRSTSATSTRSCPNAAQLADSRAPRRHPGLRAQGRPDEGVQLLPAASRATSGGSNDKTFKMMDDLGQNYLDTGHYPEAIVLYRDLMSRDKRRRSAASTRRTSPRRRWR